jgi:hypothetical protein
MKLVQPLALAALFAAGAAQAQSFNGTNIQPVSGGFNAPSLQGPSQPTDVVLVNRIVGGVPTTGGLPISSFASQQDLANAIAQLGGNRDWSREINRLQETQALASAITILPPNPGDRFSLTFSGAGNDTNGAGAISGSYRITESALAFGGYARSSTQNLVKGGVSLSFR